MLLGNENEEDMTNDINMNSPLSSKLLLMNNKCNLEECYMQDDHGKGLKILLEKKKKQDKFYVIVYVGRWFYVYN